MQLNISKSGKDLRNRCVFRRWQKNRQSIAEDWAAGGNEFQMTDAATGNERRPTVVRRYVGTCSSWDVDERRRWRPEIVEKQSNELQWLNNADGCAAAVALTTTAGQRS